MSATIESFCLETISRLIMPQNTRVETAKTLKDCMDTVRTVQVILSVWSKVNNQPDQTEHDSELSRRNAQLALDMDNALAAKHWLLEAVEKVLKVCDKETALYLVLREARDKAVASSGDIGGHEEDDLE